MNLEVHRDKMNKNYIDTFDRLNINLKKNKISNELMSIGELIKIIEKKLGLEQSYIKIKNYDIDKDKELLEKQILTFYFEDIYEIKK